MCKRRNQISININDVKVTCTDITNVQWIRHSFDKKLNPTRYHTQLLTICFSMFTCIDFNNSTRFVESIPQDIYNAGTAHEALVSRTSGVPT